MSRYYRSDRGSRQEIRFRESDPNVEPLEGELFINDDKLVVRLDGENHIVAPPEAAGTQGPQGNQGPIGPQGSTGATGTQGAKGDPGVQGAMGYQGPQGFTGQQGSTGLQGMTGSQGPQGNTGTQGTTGAQGVQGSTGLQGMTGSQGPQGNTGTQGTTGAQGVQGAPGISGGGLVKVNPVIISSTYTIDCSLGNYFVYDATGSTSGRLRPWIASVSSGNTSNSIFRMNTQYPGNIIFISYDTGGTNVTPVGTTLLGSVAHLTKVISVYRVDTVQNSYAMTTFTNARGVILHIEDTDNLDVSLSVAGNTNNPASVTTTYTNELVLTSYNYNPTTAIRQPGMLALPPKGYDLISSSCNLWDGSSYSNELSISGRYYQSPGTADPGLIYSLPTSGNRVIGTHKIRGANENGHTNLSFTNVPSQSYFMRHRITPSTKGFLGRLKLPTNCTIVCDVPPFNDIGETFIADFYTDDGGTSWYMSDYKKIVEVGI